MQTPPRRVARRRASKDFRKGMHVFRQEHALENRYSGGDADRGGVDDSPAAVQNMPHDVHACHCSPIQEVAAPVAGHTHGIAGMSVASDQCADVGGGLETEVGCVVVGVAEITVEIATVGERVKIGAVNHAIACDIGKIGIGFFVQLMIVGQHQHHVGRRALGNERWHQRKVARRQLRVGARHKGQAHCRQQSPERCHKVPHTGTMQ